MKTKLVLFGKGLLTGASMMVPGVSGGTMAIILGVYEQLLAAVSHFFEQIKKNLITLCFFAAGGIIGILLFAKGLSYLMEHFTVPMSFFFIGAVLGGLPTLWHKARTTATSHLTTVLFLLIGIAAAVGINCLPHDLMTANSTSVSGILLLFAAGIVLAVALIAPGISFSYMLLVFGIYERTLEAISDFDILFLLPIGLGGITGMILFAKLMDHAMHRWEQQTYGLIIGFVLASAASVFPGIPQGWDLLWSPLLLVAGIAAMYFLSKTESNS